MDDRLMKNTGAATKKPVLAFYLDNNKCHDCDFSNVRVRNPGVGGTEFQFVRIAVMLSDAGFDVYFITTSSMKPERIPLRHLFVAADANQAIQTACDQKVDIIFFKNLEVPKKPSGSSIKSVAWLHNYPGPMSALRATKDRNVDYFIFGTQAFMDYYKPFGLYKRSFCCPLLPSPRLKIRPFPGEKRVMYIGSGTPIKSLDYLTSVWPSVAKKVPDARLVVAAGWDLYDKTSSEHSQDELRYRDEVLKPIRKSGCEGTVTFSDGSLTGLELEKLVATARVGVVNPRAEDETFCLSALDFERQGVPLVYRYKNGLRDTIGHAAGLSFKSRREMKNRIITLLRDQKTNMSLGASAFDKADDYSETNVATQWSRAIFLVNSSLTVPNAAYHTSLFSKVIASIRFIRVWLRKH